MRTPHDPEDVEPALRRVEADLARRLEEACDDIDRRELGQESMDELLRLEEDLLAAARAAEEAVRLRRQLADRPSTSRGSDASTAPAPEPPPSEATTVYRVREFTDNEGRQWRVWQVRPRSGGRANAERYLGQYVKGWLAFELLAGDLRKRLPSFPEDWLRMRDEELEDLRWRAVDVPTRKDRPGGRHEPL
jgi:hypothetical protein